jgi:hypothetical protein
MIGLYKGHVFQGSNKMWQEYRIVHLGKWDGSDEVFFTTYHHEFPNERLQIYLHKYKPLSRTFKANIDQYMKKDPYFIELNREEKLNDLLS